MKTERQTPNAESVNRRHFLKIASGAAVCLLGIQSSQVFGGQVECKKCGIGLSESSALTTKTGKCRNCGADVKTGEMVLPRGIVSARGGGRRVFFREASVPFPHPEIQSFTTKVCGSLSDIRSGKSRIRNT